MNDRMREFISDEIAGIHFSRMLEGDECPGGDKCECLSEL